MLCVCVFAQVHVCSEADRHYTKPLTWAYEWTHRCELWFTCHFREGKAALKP